MLPRHFVPTCPVSLLRRAVTTPYGAGESLLNMKHSGTKKSVSTRFYSHFQPCSFYTLNIVNVNANVRICITRTLRNL